MVLRTCLQCHVLAKEECQNHSVSLSSDLLACRLCVQNYGHPTRGDHPAPDFPKYWKTQPVLDESSVVLIAYFS